METLIIPYTREPGARFARPMIAITVRNPKNGLSVDVLALIDTGSDITILEESLLDQLGLERSALLSDGYKGANDTEEKPSPISMELELYLAETKTRIAYSVDGRPGPIPIGFAPIIFEGLLGRTLCLDLMKAIFDGPAQAVTLRI